MVIAKRILICVAPGVCHGIADFVERAVFLYQIVHQLDFVLLFHCFTVADVIYVIGNSMFSFSIWDSVACCHGFYPSIEPQSYTTFSGNGEAPSGSNFCKLINTYARKQRHAQLTICSNALICIQATESTP